MITLNHVKIVSLIHSKKQHTFRVETDAGELLRIRLHQDAPFEEMVDYIKQLQNCFVDLEVQPIDWVIRDRSGTSLILHEIKQV